MTTLLLVLSLCLGDTSAPNARPTDNRITMPFPIMKKTPYRIRRAIVPAAISFVGGAAWGLHEATMHHWPAFHARFPGANPQYWNPAISWKNKYWRNVPSQISDAKHLMVTIQNVSLFGAGLTLTIGRRRPVWHYVLDAGVSLASYSIGNWFTYNLLYR